VTDLDVRTAASVALVIIATVFILALLALFSRRQRQIEWPPVASPRQVRSPAADLKALPRHPSPSAPFVASSPADPDAAWAALPTAILFVDVETTGLGLDDRVVSFGATHLTREGALIWRAHYVFNPQKRSHPRARAVHGWDEATLARQELFADRAAEIAALFAASELVVAHNAAFDLRFIDAEFAHAGLPPVRIPSACTMLEWRARGLGPADLASVGARIGVVRRGAQHDALEDSQIAMQAFLWLRGCPFVEMLPLPNAPPDNFRAAPPKRPRGRPKGSRNRPKTSGDGGSATARS